MYADYVQSTEWCSLLCTTYLYSVHAPSYSIRGSLSAPPGSFLPKSHSSQNGLGTLFQVITKLYVYRINKNINSQHAPLESLPSTPDPALCQLLRHQSPRFWRFRSHRVFGKARADCLGLQQFDSKDNIVLYSSHDDSCYRTVILLLLRFLFLVLDPCRRATGPPGSYRCTPPVSHLLTMSRQS